MDGWIDVSLLQSQHCSAIAFDAYKPSQRDYILSMNQLLCTDETIGDRLSAQSVLVSIMASLHLI